MTLLAEVAAYLDAQLTELTSATNLFAGQLPDAPDACVSLHELTASPPIHTQGSPLPSWEEPRVQVYVRGSRDGYAAARALAELVWRTLHLVDTELSGTHYHSLRAISSVTFLSRDTQERPVFSWACEAMKELS